MEYSCSDIAVDCQGPFLRQPKWLKWGLPELQLTAGWPGCESPALSLSYSHKYQWKWQQLPTWDPDFSLLPLWVPMPQAPAGYFLNVTNKRVLGTSLIVQWLGLCLPTQEVRVQSLVEELRSNLPCCQKTKTYNRNNTVTNSIKTFQNWSRSKNKNTKKPKRVLLRFL